MRIADAPRDGTGVNVAGSNLAVRDNVIGQAQACRLYSVAASEYVCHITGRVLMKWIAIALTVVGLAALSLSVPAPFFTSKAFASKMDGKGSGCSDRSCRGINSPN